MGFAGSFRSCRAIQGGFLLLAMLVSYLVNDTWSLPSLSRSTEGMELRNELVATDRKAHNEEFSTAGAHVHSNEAHLLERPCK